MKFAEITVLIESKEELSDRQVDAMLGAYEEIELAGRIEDTVMLWLDSREALCNLKVKVTES